MSEETVRIEPCPATCGLAEGCDKCIAPAVLNLNAKDETKAQAIFGQLPKQK